MNIKYDSNPYNTPHKIGKFESTCANERNAEISTSFKKAKRMARALIQKKIDNLNKELAKLDEITAETCPTIKNPFT
jgi:hypothetical protein